jgi:hypothetical protein
LLSPLFAHSFATKQSARAILSAGRIPTSPFHLERRAYFADRAETHLEALAKWRNEINEKIIHKALKGAVCKFLIKL